MTLMRRNKCVLAVLLLAGCGPLVQIGGNDAPPDALLTLRAREARAGGAAHGAATLAIATPGMPGALQTLRLPVLTGDTAIAYLKDATWVEQPNRLFQRLLSDVVTARAGIIVLEGGRLAVPERQLAGQLLEFGLDVRNSAQPVVRVRYDAVLTRSDGRLLGVRRFEAVHPVTAQTSAVVGAALNAAANEVASQVADWLAQAR